MPVSSFACTVSGATLPRRDAVDVLGEALASTHRVLAIDMPAGRKRLESPWSERHRRFPPYLTPRS
jgi:hypothetical protein